MNRLVISADDFGLSPEVNEAVEAAHRKGVLTAASLMVAGSAAGRAVALARRLPGLRIGLHLVLVDGPAVLTPKAIPGLALPGGGLRGDMIRLSFALAGSARLRRQLDREIAAQFAAFRATRLPLDHVNAHRHFHLHPLVAGRVLAIGSQNGMAALRAPCEPGRVLAAIEPEAQARGLDPAAFWARLLRWRAIGAGLRAPDAVFGLRWSGAMTRDRLLGLLALLPPGFVEIYTHPATGGGFAGHAPGYRYADELAALIDPEVIAAVAGAAHRPGGYVDG